MSDNILIPREELKRLRNVLAMAAHPYPSPHAQYVDQLMAEHGYEIEAKRERNERLGAAIDNACAVLPADWALTINLERNAGTITLYDAEGDEVREDFGGGDGLDEEINEAVKYAQEPSHG